MENAVVFGSNGQDAHFLKTLLLGKKLNFIGVSRRNADIVLDISNYNAVAEVIIKFKPCFIFHLAATSSTKHDYLFDNHDAISTGTLNILEAVRKHQPNAKVFISGSAMQFKNNGLPINENTPFEAKSPYAVSRIHAVYLTRYYRDTFGLKVYVGYFFNHDSEYRSNKHVNRIIVEEIIKIKNNQIDHIRIGDIHVKKEFNYAGDIVNAVWILLNQDKIFECVIGSGKAYSIYDWINIVCKNLKVELETNKIVTDTLFTPEYSVLVSDPKIIFELGWNPMVDIHELAKLMIKTYDSKQ